MTNDQYNAANHLVNLLFKDIAVKKSILTACTDPQQYVAENEEALGQRGIEQPLPGLFWIAVVNGLAANNNLVELDWKQSAGDLYNAVVWLLSSHTKASEIIKKIDDAAIADHLTIELSAPHFNKVLNEFELTLVVLDIDSDSYPFMITETKNCSLIKEYLEVLDMGKVIILK